MDNPETLPTLDTQDTGRRQNKTQHRKLKRWTKRTPPTTGDHLRCSRRVRRSCLV